MSDERTQEEKRADKYNWEVARVQKLARKFIEDAKKLGRELDLIIIKDVVIRINEPEKESKKVRRKKWYHFNRPILEGEAKDASKLDDKMAKKSTK